MQLCLMIEGQEGVTWPQWRALAEACERHGVPALLRSDHYMNLDGRHPERGSLDAWATICALAAVTSKLRLGTMVSPATFRHPSELARVVLTADHVSGGRVELGLGAGWHEREHEAHGFPFAPLRTRMDVLEEQLQVVLGSWTEETFSFAGEHYELRDLQAQPEAGPEAAPTADHGRQRRAPQRGSGGEVRRRVQHPFATVDQVLERRQQVDRACEQAGRDPIPFSIMTGVLVGRDQAELRSRAQRLGEKMGADPQASARGPARGLDRGDRRCRPSSSCSRFATPEWPA